MLRERSIDARAWRVHRPPTGLARAMARLPVLWAALALACAEDTAGPDNGGFLRTEEGLLYRASTAVLESFPVQLRTHVNITNATGSDIDLTFPDGCVVLIRAYREGSSQPAWDQRANTGCTAALVRVHLGPGESQEFVAATDARAILGDSLPDGNYRLRAVLRPQTGEVIVDAGTAPLAVPRS